MCSCYAGRFVPSCPILQSSPAANGFIMAASVAVPGCFPCDVVEAWYWVMNHV